MTQQELDAIKKKCENAKEIGLTGAHMAAAVFDAYLKDIPALLAEVERLREESADYQQSQHDLFVELCKIKDAQQWIPVTEGLPCDVLDLKDNKQIKVLVFTSSRLIKSCLFGWDKDYNGNFVGWKFTRYDVTHWMPLPEPPTKMKDDDFCSYGERKED